MQVKNTLQYIFQLLRVDVTATTLTQRVINNKNISQRSANITDTEVPADTLSIFISKVSAIFDILKRTSLAVVAQLRDGICVVVSLQWRQQDGRTVSLQHQTAPSIRDAVVRALIELYRQYRLLLRLLYCQPFRGDYYDIYQVAQKCPT